VIVLVPRGTFVVAMVATPFVMVAVPSVVVPSVNVTLPVALVGRVEVIVTVLPTVLGPEVVTVTDGVTFDTTCVVVPVAELLFVSPA